MKDDDVLAKLAALRDRVTGNTRPAQPARVNGVDPLAFDAAVERVVGEREHRQAEAAARAEQQRAVALAVGGPCQRCGVTRSWEHDPEADRDVGRWYGSTCAWCESDRAWGVAGRTDVEHRELVVRRLLPAETTSGYGFGYLAQTSGFRWWHETPGAPTSPTVRFAYLDRDELAARLADRPPAFTNREPCRRCGCPGLWTHGTSHDPHRGTVEVWTCAGCGRFHDLVDLAAWASGLNRPAIEDLGIAAERVLGVHWWADDPAGGAADPPRPGPPFAYLDRRAARARAWEVYGTGDWAERRFTGPAAYAAAREAASS